MKGGEYHLNGNISLAAPPVPVLEPDRGPVSARTPRFPSQVSHSGQRAQGTCSLLVSPFCWSQHLSPRFCWGFSQRSAPPWPPWPPWLGLQPAQVPLLGPQVQCRPCNDSARPSPPPNVSYFRGAHRGPWRLPVSWKGQRGGLGEGRTVGRKTEALGGRGFPFSAPRLLPVGSSDLPLVLGWPRKKSLWSCRPLLNSLCLGHSVLTAGLLLPWPWPVAMAMARFTAECALQFPSVFASALPSPVRGPPQWVGRA